MTTSLSKRLFTPLTLVIVFTCLSIWIAARYNVNSFIKETSSTELNNINQIQEKLLKKSLNATYEMLYLFAKNPIFIKSLEDSFIGESAKITASNEIQNILKIDPSYYSIHILNKDEVHRMNSLKYTLINDRIEKSEIILKDSKHYFSLRTPLKYLDDEVGYIILTLSLEHFLKESFSTITSASNYSFKINSFSNSEVIKSRNFKKTTFYERKESEVLDIIYENYATNILAIELSSSLFRITIFIALLSSIILFLSIYLVLQKYILTPMVKISKAANIFEKNKINDLVIDDSSLEFNQLTTQLYKMKNIIIQSFDNIEQSNQKLEETVKLRTRDLEISLLKEKRSAQAKTDFLANMSHELRTPLNSIIGFSQILKDENINEECDQYIFDINESARFLKSLINDILDLTKIESGQIVLNKELIPINDLIHSIQSIVKIKLDSKTSNIEYDLSPQLPPALNIDFYKLVQVLINLISNSVKFSSKQKVPKIKVSIFKKENYENRLYFSVEDNGKGVDVSRSDFLFNSFQQEDISLVKEFQGTGLGLYIAKKIILYMQGDIYFLKKETEGALVEFYISHNAEEIAEDDANEKLNLNSEQYRTLVVEDNKINQRLILSALKKMNITDIEIADNGLIALEKTKQKDFDLIFMDLQMPKMDGLTATSKIKAFYEVRKNRKEPIIIALTANAFKEDEIACYKVGMSYYLTKPLDFKKLKKILIEIDYKVKKAS
ncbi:response regulator [Halobacteriovorax sp. HLS]|uniref:hybrid sensor histidine kinase/response regulator n=1 Tax=Halobacteriovorax sp. HLS TaxID=2234000 RepID=UPI0013E3D466|nr:response regulator [Halobacteriovorax sp. HLS]